MTYAQVAQVFHVGIIECVMAIRIWALYQKNAVVGFTLAFIVVSAIIHSVVVSGISLKVGFHVKLEHSFSRTPYYRFRGFRVPGRQLSVS